MEINGPAPRLLLLLHAGSTYSQANPGMATIRVPEWVETVLTKKLWQILTVHSLIAPAHGGNADLLSCQRQLGARNA